MSFNLIANNCIKNRKQLPNMTPVMYSLSTTSSASGNYSCVNITGENFYPNGITYVNFGSFKNISITYESSFNISFVVPTAASAGSYDVIVVDSYSGSLAPRVLYSYLPNLNYSNTLQYQIT